eukprot:scaffold5229_cov102-Isochrysis_galbana.AAC.2
MGGAAAGERERDRGIGRGGRGRSWRGRRCGGLGLGDDGRAEVEGSLGHAARGGVAPFEVLNKASARVACGLGSHAHTHTRPDTRPRT